MQASLFHCSNQAAAVANSCRGQAPVCSLCAFHGVPGYEFFYTDSVSGGLLLSQGVTISPGLAHLAAAQTGVAVSVRRALKEELIGKQPREHRCILQSLGPQHLRASACWLAKRSMGMLGPVPGSQQPQECSGLGAQWLQICQAENDLGMQIDS